jgi:osmoprotectant transport system permease protein
MKRLLFLLLMLTPLVVAASDRPIRIASKNFNESYVLAEIMSQLLESEGFEVDRKFGMGGTLVCYEALSSDEIDVYAEYTGTLGQVILKIDDPAPQVNRLNRLLEPVDLLVLESFGFNNTYAIAIKQELAEDLELTRVSQLVDHQDLDMAFSLEFLNREDGWPGLSQTYGFDRVPTGIEHGLAYQAIDEGKIDITDAYSTDGDLERYRLTTLIDDKQYFPQYFAVPFLRKDTPESVKVLISQLAGRIDDDRMRELNAQVVVEGKTFAQVAQQFLAEEALGEIDIDNSVFWKTLANNTLVHLKLTVIALGLGVLAGVPIGVLVFRSRSVSRVMVYLAGLMQTIPSIALLALMIPIFGIGELPAIVALFLYSILPILRNTITALISIDPLLKRISEAIGLTRPQQLWYVLIPMAMPNMLAGIKTAAIISIGTATLAAFIGAGGLGEPIVTGLALNDTNLILQGAIPAACLAIIVELLFELLERTIVKEHMLSGQLPE